MKEILKVKDLSVSNKDVEILKNISFHIKKGEILGIVGESGCGKSTLIRALIQMMNKSEKITNGEILFNEKNLLLLDNKQIRKMSIVEFFIGMNVSDGALEVLMTILIFNSFKTN